LTLQSSTAGVSADAGAFPEAHIEIEHRPDTEVARMVDAHAQPNGA